MKKKEFRILIESIGFYGTNKFNYYYKGFEIYLYNNYYFYKDSEWIYYYYNDLTPLENYFKKDMRSYKLKQLLR